MGVFEEDDRINVSTLIKLWVSEGFLKAKNDESLETIAERFLKDLVDRNLILVHGLGSTGRIRCCKVHDLLRDFCLNEAQKNGFYHVIGVDNYRGISSQRRVVIQRKTSEKKVLEELNYMPHARSIICEYGNFPNCPNTIPSCRNLRLLRILHAHNRYHTNNKDQSYMNFLVSQNVNLRHLAIGGSTNSSFFSSLNLVWNLQTLIVTYSSSPVPVEIRKMAQIKHIEFVLGSWYLPNLPSDMNDVVIMKNLELKGIRNFKFSDEMVKRIPNINKLKIYYTHLPKGDDYYFTNIKLLSKLESIYITIPRNLGYKEDPCAQKLTFPHSLQSLSLSMSSDFEWEEMLEKIGWLPLLQKLKLMGGCFGTSNWQVVEGQFPSLKFLELYQCVGLKQWTVEESYMLPRLEHLSLNGMRELEEISCEIGDIPTLQKIWLTGCSNSAMKSAKEIIDEQVEMQGEELSFHVEVWLSSKNEALESLASPNFIVHFIW